MDAEKRELIAAATAYRRHDLTPSPALMCSSSQRRLGAGRPSCPMVCGRCRGLLQTTNPFIRHKAGLAACADSSELGKGLHRAHIRCDARHMPVILKY